MRILIAGNQTLNIGKTGEHEALRVQFPISDWLKDFGNGVFQLLHKRSGDAEALPVAVTSDSEYVYWLVSRSDVAYDGLGNCELVLMVDGAVAKSQTWLTRVEQSISSDGETPPDAFKSWVDTVLEAAGMVKQYADAANKSAEAAKGYADSAESSANSAKSHSTDAEQSAKDAEKYAGDAETAESNALNYKNDAESARDNAESAKDGADSAKGDAEVSRNNAQSAEQGAVVESENAKGYAKDAGLAKTGAEKARAGAEIAAKMAEGYAEDAKNAAKNTVQQTEESLSRIVSYAVNAADRADSNAKLSEDARDASVAAKNQAEQAKKDAEGYRENIEQAKNDAESARDEAVAADKSAGESKTAAAESEKNAKDAESRSGSNAESAEGWAVGQHGGVPVPESDPSYQNNSKHYADEAKNARNDVADSVNGVAQESTAAAMLENLGLIVGYLQTIIERGNSSGDLNGFALNRTESGEVVLSYTNPDDETDTDSIIMPTNETLLTLNQGWALKGDVKGFFPSTLHTVAKEAVNANATDYEAVTAVNTVIDSFGGDRGIGLGSQVSQLVELAVLNEMDHFIKERLHIKYYVRYMDDFILIHPDKEYLKYCLREIREHLEAIGLELNKKTTLIPLSQGVKLMKWKFVITDTGRILQLMNKKKPVAQRRKLKRLWEKEQNGLVEAGTTAKSLEAWLANADRGDTYVIQQKMKQFYKELTKGGCVNDTKRILAAGKG